MIPLCLAGNICSGIQSKIARCDDIPEFFVPPPPFSEGIFPCSDCHADMDVNPERRKLEDEHVEISEMFNHASEQTMVP